MSDKRQDCLLFLIGRDEDKMGVLVQRLAGVVGSQPVELRRDDAVTAVVYRHEP